MNLNFGRSCNPGYKEGHLLDILVRIIASFLGHSVFAIFFTIFNFFDTLVPIIFKISHNLLVVFWEKLLTRYMFSSHFMQLSDKI